MLCDITSKKQQQIPGFPTHLPNCFYIGRPRAFQGPQVRCMFKCSDGQAAPGYLVSSRATPHRPGPRAGLALLALRDSLNRAVAAPLDLLFASTSEPRLCHSWPWPRPRPRPRSRSPRVPPGRRRAWSGGAASPSLWRPAHRLPPASAAPASDWLRRAAHCPIAADSRQCPAPSDLR